MAASIRKINPAEARKILESNTHNRAANKAVIGRYARAMASGEWTLSNDIICVGADGVLMNGQHRLFAVIESGTTQEFWIWYDCPQEALMAMDMGRRREAADVATLAGTPITKTQAKALRLIHTNWNSRTTITATPGQLIEWSHEWLPYLETAQRGLPGHYKNHALILAAAAEAWRWCGSDTKLGAMAWDFLSIAVDNMPATDRPTDSKGTDSIPFHYHRWVQSLLKRNKRLSAFSHYKTLLNGLQAYLNGDHWGTSRQLDVETRDICKSILDRF